MYFSDVLCGHALILSEYKETHCDNFIRFSIYQGNHYSFQYKKGMFGTKAKTSYSH